MARIRKTITLDEKIEKAQEAVEKTKARYDAAVKELRDLLEKKNAQRKQWRTAQEPMMRSWRF